MRGLIGLLLKTGLPLSKKVIQSLAKSVLTPLSFTQSSAGMSKKNLKCLTYNNTNNIN